MYTALNLAKYIVSKCIKDNHPISNLQLQKILYYIQRDYLQRDSIAFSDTIEAWQFGPVVPNVYYYYCGSAAMPIISSPEVFAIKSNDAIFIDKIIEEKRVLAPWDMVSETHKPNGAWARSYKLGEHEKIPPDLIKAVG